MPSTNTHTVKGIPTMNPEERRKLVMAPFWGTRDPEIERRLFGVTVHSGTTHGGACAADHGRGASRERVAVEHEGLAGYKSYWQNPHFRKHGDKR